MDEPKTKQKKDSTDTMDNEYSTAFSIYGLCTYTEQLIKSSDRNLSKTIVSSLWAFK